MAESYNAYILRRTKEKDYWKGWRFWSKDITRYFSKNLLDARVFSKPGSLRGTCTQRGIDWKDPYFEIVQITITWEIK